MDLGTGLPVLYDEGRDRGGIRDDGHTCDGLPAREAPLEVTLRGGAHEQLTSRSAVGATGEPLRGAHVTAGPALVGGRDALDGDEPSTLRSCGEEGGDPRPLQGPVVTEGFAGRK